MKLIAIFALAFVVVTYAVEPPKIVRSEFKQDPEGSYVYAFETEDGTSQQETGSLVSAVDEENKPVTILTKSGSWSYTNPEGQVETISYTADDKGFHPVGPSIPVAPASY